METLATIVGYILMVCLCLAAVIIPLMMLVDKVGEIYKHWLWREESRGAMAAGKLLVQRAYWFSEDKSAMNALIAAGEAFRDRGADPDTSQVRERWYALNKESKS